MLAPCDALHRWCPTAPRSGETGTDLYDDDESRAFYEQLPDLKAVLPALLFGDPTEGGKEGGKEGAGRGGEERAPAELERLLGTLPLCNTREQLDGLASELCAQGLRFHRRKLVKALLAPPRGKPSTLPCYARLAATLHPCFRHVGSELLAALCADFEQLRDGAETQSREREMQSRVANAVYLGELTKFGVAPPDRIFSLLKSLFDDFSPSHAQARHPAATRSPRDRHCVSLTTSRLRLRRRRRQHRRRRRRQARRPPPRRAGHLQPPRDMRPLPLPVG